MWLLWLAWGCAPRLGIPDVSYAGSASVPLVRTSNDSRWFVPAEVDGHGDWVWFFDTGYSYTTCDDGLIDALGLVTRGRRGVRGELGRLQTTKARLPPIAIGDHVLDGLVCQVRDLHGTSSIRDPREVRVAGVLGMDVIRPFRVVMDPSTAEVRFDAPMAAPPLEVDAPGAVRLRREYRFGIRPVVPVEVAGRTLWPVLDTGANGTHLDAAGLGLEPVSVQEGVTVRGTGGNGSSVRTIAYYDVPDLGFAGQSARAVISQRTGGPGAGLLGLNVLSRYRATYDFRRGVAQFEPVDATRLPSFTEWRERSPDPAAIRVGGPR